MNDDKITISMEEVNRATPVPGMPAPQVFTSEYVPPDEPDRPLKLRRTGLFVGLGIAVVALLCITGIGVMAYVGGNGMFPRGARTVSDYRDGQIRRIEAELAKPDSKLRKRIEDAHLTVTVKSTRVVQCDVTTVDGSDKAGTGDSNIDKVSMLIRFNWEGVLDSGYSDLRLEYDVRNDRMLKSEIEYTTAIVNAEDPAFWREVGAVIGSML